MNTIDGNDFCLSETAPALPDASPEFSFEAEAAAGAPDRLAQENARLRRENAALAQERDMLRMVIDSLPDNIYAKDRQGRFLLNNSAHAESLGARSPAEMTGRSDFDYFPRELAAQFHADEQAILESGKPLINQEQYKPRLGDPLGARRWRVCTKVLWRDARGGILGTLGITRDIHELKMTQEALRQSEAKLREFAAQLERSNRELQDFAYVASHDLQEPLRKIVVFGERLKEKCADAFSPDGRDYLGRMQKAASRMQNLINDLLAFSRVTTKAQPFAPVDLAEIAREAVNDLEARIEQARGRVEVGALPLIDGEALQLRRLLQNLIGNALKFHRPDEPPVVKVQARMVSGVSPQTPPGAPPMDLCQLTVSDNGIGFDEKYLDRIFNVFQRLHTRDEYEGTGMGLAIAHKIALHHGGDLTAKSQPGKGAAFIVTLPVAHPKPAPNA
ncbi:MAG: PAS domain-containing protein [Verrucomicrobiota bacterium]|nr:PAS domain-containing protein [Verrucomicrobiota bacterium]